MNKETNDELTLFDLLAREWDLDCEIVQVEFNSDDSAVLFRLSSGKIAIVTTNDAESTKRRTRVEIDTGRTTISKRKKPIPSARFLEIRINSKLPVVRMGQQGFLAVDETGTAFQITARGQCVQKSNIPVKNATAVCSSTSTELIAIALSSSITVIDTKSQEKMIEVNLNRKIECMAFSSNGRSLAAWGEDCLSLIDLQNSSSPVKILQGIPLVTEMTWDGPDNHIACASSSKEFHIIDVRAGTFQKVTNYPSEVSDTTFNENGNALITSGAFRLVGWSTENLPMNDMPGTPMKTGKSGLVVINAVAAHPKRSLMAAGYKNGLVTIASIGSDHEMLVHQENSTQVNSMSWSGTGDHLAIGFQSGKAAVVSFPNQLFKYPSN